MLCWAFRYIVANVSLSPSQHVVFPFITMSKHHSIFEPDSKPHVNGCLCFPIANVGVFTFLTFAFSLCQKSIQWALVVILFFAKEANSYTHTHIQSCVHSSSGLFQHLLTSRWSRWVRYGYVVQWTGFLRSDWLSTCWVCSCAVMSEARGFHVTDTTLIPPQW